MVHPELLPVTFAACGSGVILMGIHMSYKPGVGTLLGEYRPEVLTVMTERSEVRTKMNEG